MKDIKCNEGAVEGKWNIRSWPDNVNQNIAEGLRCSGKGKSLLIRLDKACISTSDEATVRNAFYNFGGPVIAVRSSLR